MSDEKLLDLLKTQSEILQEMINAKQDHTKTPANFSTYTPQHGSAGIFATPGLERDIISAHIRPFGLASILPRFPSVYLDPRFGSLTGFTAPSGSQPTYACQDAPQGYMKGCNLTARFGRLRFDTQTIDIDDVMLKLHRGDFTDLNLRGKLLGLPSITPSGVNEGDILNITTMAEMVIAAVNLERTYTNWLWQGVVTVANQFPGLDVQIATGQQDADTGTLCPALDSDVKNFAYQNVNGSGNRDIVEYLSSMMWYLNNIADDTGLAPVEWVIAMRRGLWHELSAIWPCAYNTFRCGVRETTLIDAVPSIDATDMTAQRDAMRNGMYIDIEGKRYRVVLDTGIFEHNSTNNANLTPGSYASSIYAVPLTIAGGMPVTYQEYVDFSQAQSDVNLLRGMQQFFWTDNGLYSWAYEQVKWCYKLALKVEPRVVLRTPQLAGRIDAIRYSPLQHERDSDPSSAYFLDGGVSIRPTLGLSTPQAVWGL